VKFWLETCEDIQLKLRTREMEKFVEAAIPIQAAKMFAEMGASGRSVMRDEQGNLTVWTLHATVVHYAYPVSEAEAKLELAGFEVDNPK